MSITLPDRVNRPKFPVSFEISRSVQYFKGVNSREQKRDTYKDLISMEPEEIFLREPDPDTLKNIHDEYAHLALAEQRKFDGPLGDFVWDIQKREEDRKVEAFELQKYFRRVFFYEQPKQACCICSFSDFVYSDDIYRHMVVEHTHIYVCIFRFAGCTAKFTNKTQWKCHVACEHLNWVCGERVCPNKRASPRNHYWKENHRMISKAQKAPYHQALRKTALKALEALDRYEKVLSVKLGCPIRDCDSEFEGGHCWDERMEHIAEHIKESAIYVEEYPCGNLDVIHSNDQLFVGWALKENIVGRSPRGKFWLQDID